MSTDWLKALANSPVAKLNPHLVQVSDKAKGAKYKNEKVIDEFGNEYDSKKEYKRRGQLRLLLKAGKILFLARQVEFTFHIEGEKVASYFADYVYMKIETMELVVEDIKSKATRMLPAYRLKKKMMLLQHKIIIKEI